MAKVGDFVKLYVEGEHCLLEAGRGFIKRLGDKFVEIERENGSQLKMKLAHVAIEKCEVDANEHNHCRPGAMHQIKNKATGSGFTRKGGKAHFGKDTTWENRPGRFEDDTI